MTTKSYHPPRSARGARIRVTAAPKVFGTWRFVAKMPGERDQHNTAKVYCGTDQRLKMEWKKNLGRDLMAAMIWAANKRLAELGARHRICK